MAYYCRYTEHWAGVSILHLRLLDRPNLPLSPGCTVSSDPRSFFKVMEVERTRGRAVIGTGFSQKRQVGDWPAGSTHGQGALQQFVSDGHLTIPH